MDEPTIESLQSEIEALKAELEKVRRERNGFEKAFLHAWARLDPPKESDFDDAEIEGDFGDLVEELARRTGDGPG